MENIRIHSIEHNEEEKNFYREHYNYLNRAIERVLSRVEEFRAKEEQNGTDSDPIENYKSRIKTAQSMKEKLQRCGMQISLENALKNIYDAAGIRILCTFLDDVYRIAEWLKNDENIEVYETKDYIAKPKPNGYRSYHMIALVDVIDGDENHSVFVEIQIRTIAMDCWASLEHQLKYKKTIKYQDMMIKELKRCADEIAAVDLNLQTIKYIIDLGENEAAALE